MNGEWCISILTLLLCSLDTLLKKLHFVISYFSLRNFIYALYSKLGRIIAFSICLIAFTLSLSDNIFTCIGNGSILSLTDICLIFS